MSFRTGVASTLLATTAILAPVAPVAAQANAVATYDLPAQDLETSLRSVSRTSGQQIIIASSAVAGRTAPALNGQYTVEQAVRALLAGTDIRIEITPSAVLVGDRASAAAAPADNEAGDGDAITVTGTRIRGAVPIAPVISATSSEIEDAGLSNLGAYVRSLPQSFSGGQNPGVGTSAGGVQNENINSSSTINLRGLGPDATLTLLNGHRMPYDGAQQGIDVSAIPLLAVDRIEIVADGASALYGSDAVGGVANIILKRDFEGVAASGRVGTSTGGGGLERQAGLVAGSKWSGGGFIAGIDFEKDSAILAGDRALTANLNPAHTLMRPTRRLSGTFAAHQSIGSGLEASVDGFYNRRIVSNVVPFGPALSYLQRGRTGFARTKTYSIAPSLKASFANGWVANFVVAYGQNKVRYGNDVYIGGRALVSQRGCYCNEFWSVEGSAEGSVIDLPGGPARLAVGGGYRSNRLRATRSGPSGLDISADQDTYFAYAEGILPLVDPSLEIPLVRRLQINGAMRFENYPGIDQVLTPKVGLIYSLTNSLDIRGSWGRSFKAPTLYQLSAPKFAVYDYAQYYSGTVLPPDAKVVELAGGNADLKPERAKTWTATLAWHPTSVRGFSVEASYFSTRYRDRVVQPITYLSSALSAERYADLILRTPTNEQLSSALAHATLFNYTDGEYDPNSVIAIVHNLYRNAASQSIKGVDILARYQRSFGSLGDLILSGNVSYLESNQQLSSKQPVEQLSGTIFNPPHWRARQSVSWTNGSTAATALVNYIGSVTDNRLAPAVTVGSMTTVDLSIRHEFKPRSPGALELSVSVSNLFNSHPDRISTASPTAEPYDSANYSIVGRTIGVGATVKW